MSLTELNLSKAYALYLGHLYKPVQFNDTKPRVLTIERLITEIKWCMDQPLQVKLLLRMQKDLTKLEWDYMQSIPYKNRALYLIDVGCGDVPLYCLNGATAFEAGIAEITEPKK